MEKVGARRLTVFVKPADPGDVKEPRPQIVINSPG